MRRKTILTCIRGRLWRVMFTRLRGQADGYCDHPATARRRIRIHSGLPAERELTVLIHEALHAGLWDLSEEAVTELAEDLSGLLTACGYGRPGNKQAIE